MKPTHICLCIFVSIPRLAAHRLACEAAQEKEEEALRRQADAVDRELALEEEREAAALAAAEDEVRT